MIVINRNPKIKTVFRVNNFSEISLNARNGLEEGAFFIVLRDESSTATYRDGVNFYTNINLQKAELTHSEEYGDYYRLIGAPKRFEALAVDEEHKYYIQPYTRRTAKSKMQGGQVLFHFTEDEAYIYYDPNMREIKDLEFYDNMVKLYNELDKNEAREVVRLLDEKADKDELPYKVYCYDFIKKFEDRNNPFKEGEKLTKEQVETFLSFTDAMLKEEFIGKDFQPDREYGSLMDIARKYVGESIKQK